MGNGMDKDYFNIAAMTAAFRKWDELIKKGEVTPESIQLWQVRAQLAIAQQLSVISGHLGKIVQRAKERVEPSTE